MDTELECARPELWEELALGILIKPYCLIITGEQK